MEPRAQPLAPARLAAPAIRIEDWLLAVVFGLLPVLGLVLSVGDALTWLGVGALLWVGHRAPMATPMRQAYRSMGITAILVLLCLFLPVLESAEALPGEALVRGLRLALLGIFLVGLFRRDFESTDRTRRTDFGMAVVGGLVALGWFYLHRSGELAAAHYLAQTVLSLGLVYGIRRVHLGRSQALPLLTRTALIGIWGAVIVAVLRA